MPADAMTAGLWLYTALAVVAGFLARRLGLALGALAVVWIPWLLAKDPTTARTAIILVAWAVVARYGWRWLALLASLGLLFTVFTWQQVTTGGWGLGTAVRDGLNRTVYAAAVIAVGWWLLQLVTGRGRYVANPLAWQAERRKRQSRAEHRHAMGGVRKGIGWATKRARAGVTGRALPRPPDTVDQASVRDLTILARRHGLKPGEWTTAELRDQVRQAQARPSAPATASPHPAGPPPATADDAPHPVLVEMHGTAGGYVPEPAFRDREPVWRWRS